MAGRRRRGYLLRLTKYGVQLWAGIVGGTGSLLAAPVAVGIFVGSLAVLGAGSIVAPTPTLVALVALLLLVLAMVLAARLMLSAERRIGSLPYVPPVREQIARLPATDVLLRSAELPAAAPEDLLRAARPGTGTPDDELVRPAGRGTVPFQNQDTTG